MTPRDQLGKFLRDQRRRHDWTQKEVAAKLQLRGLHVGSRTISKHETSQQIPDGDTLRHYAELYEVEFHELVALAAASAYEVDDPESISQLLTGDTVSVESFPEEHDSSPWLGLKFRRLVWVGGVLALSTVLVWLTSGWQPAPSPTRVQLVDGRLVALADERPVWSIPFADVATFGMKPLVQDVDGDGRNEIVFATQEPEPQTRTERLQCYTPDGELRWEVSLGRPQTIRGRVFTPYYLGQFLRWVETPDASYLLIVARHHMWYPAQVLLLDPKTGDRISEYWHPGYINDILQFDVGHDGTQELLLGGTNNPDHGPGHPILAILDIPFREPTHHPNLFGPLNSREHSYLVFPRPDFMDVHTELVSVGSLQPRPRNRFAAIVTNSTGGYLHYELDADLTVTDLRPTDSMVRLHNEFATEGHLDHRYSRKELDDWKHVLRFPTAPDGNSPEILAAFATRESQTKIVESSGTH